MKLTISFSVKLDRERPVLQGEPVPEGNNFSQAERSYQEHVPELLATPDRDPFADRMGFVANPR
jgi:hypothetical protein